MQECQLSQPIAVLSGRNAVGRGLLEGVSNWEVRPRNGAWLGNGLRSQPIVSEDGQRCRLRHNSAMDFLGRVSVPPPVSTLSRLRDSFRQ